MKYLLLFILFSPIVGFAAEPIWLIEVPLVSSDDGFSGYVNFLYLTTISVAALLAVIKIIIAGLKYMLSDIVTNKSDAISDIRGSIFGLLIILGAFLILNTINPNLTNSSVGFTNLATPDIKADPPPVRPAPTGTDPSPDPGAPGGSTPGGGGAAPAPGGGGPAPAPAPGGVPITTICPDTANTTIAGYKEAIVLNVGACPSSADKTTYKRTFLDGCLKGRGGVVLPSSSVPALSSHPQRADMLVCAIR
jgi:hypothetical protein